MTGLPDIQLANEDTLTDRGPLLEGIGDDLRGAAEAVLIAFDALWFAEYAVGLGMGSYGDHLAAALETEQRRAMVPFRELSSADEAGLRELGERLRECLLALSDNVQDAQHKDDIDWPQRVTDARGYISPENWEGNAGANARLRLSNLGDRYVNCTSLASSTLAVVVDARATIGTAKRDLCQLADDFVSAAESYAESKSSERGISFGEVFTDAFIGALGGLITGGPRGAIEGAVTSSAETIIGGGQEENTDLSGQSLEEIVESFQIGADNIRTGVRDSASEIVEKIVQQVNLVESA
ncbi:hypothetical protein EV191_101588 [Tamaricihabitans halophyticus]|uniref:Uncharacterized protein n=1 Tax=Tamaricihabitans halophyticus TaxID=1262583 RepID=A0A4R2R295_9PSEU|nr:hypothetical protein [Tamaricihabitans halophyticus]TCP56643.1 hypothetical protein EV191_101588 [Tamaricihabitans halophyticus]